MVSRRRPWATLNRKPMIFPDLIFHFLFSFEFSFLFFLSSFPVHQLGQEIKRLVDERKEEKKKKTRKKRKKKETKERSGFALKGEQKRCWQPTSGRDISFLPWGRTRPDVGFFFLSLAPGRGKDTWFLFINCLGFLLLFSIFYCLVSC